MTTTPETAAQLNLDELLANLADLEETLAAIRRQVEQAAGLPLSTAVDDVEAAAAVGADIVGVSVGGTDSTLRMLKFLKVFYDAPGRALTKPQANAAAKAAGYDPRGTAGFHVGKNASLKTVDESRVLTKVGRQWYELHAPEYAAELGLEDE